jgi:hypothetical protein
MIPEQTSEQREDQTAWKRQCGMEMPASGLREIQSCQAMRHVLVERAKSCGPAGLIRACHHGP